MASVLRMFALLAVLGLAAGPALADEIRLKDGRVLDGKVIAREHGRITVLVPGDRLTLREDQVQEIIPRWSAFDEYAKRGREAAASGAPTAHLALARWCHVQGLTAEMRAELRAVLARDPDHPEAHALQGDVRAGGKWMTPAEAQQRRRRLETRINRLVGVLYEGSVKEAAAAYHQLVDLARTEQITNLERLAYELWLEGGPVGTATLEVRLQRSEIRSMRTRTVSLGTGAPVTLELPEVTRTRLGTTVVVPVR